VAGKIIADIIEAPFDSIKMNVANVTVLTANNSGLTYLPTGNVNINVGSTTSLSLGNVTVSNLITANGGIKFPATQIASADANTLDDYEEGTFTPVFNNFTVGNGSVFGTYIKVGNVVHCWLGFLFGSTSSIGGTMAAIGGLPFSSRSRGGNAYIKANGLAWDNGNTWTSMMAQLNQLDSSLQFPMRTSNSATINATVPFTWANGDSLVFQITYEVA
jgi:hypothetical protein